MKILVLAGGADQIALIQELKARGHVIVLVDYYENPPAKSYADKHIVASTLDVEKVEEIAKREKVSMICTACTDQALLTVAYVSERLNLPCYLDYQTGLNVTNKLYMKKVMTDNHIPTSHYAIIDNPTNVCLHDLFFPLVVKPVDCNSSKGVKKVENVDDYLKYATDAISLSRTNSAIVEEFKTGKEVSADFYIDNGTAKLLCATTSLKIKNRNSFTILCSDYPAVTTEQEEQLITIANGIASAFHLNNTPLLVQLIVNQHEINVIEFSARMGGGSKYKLIEVLSGVNIMSKYVDRILGGYPKLNPMKQVDYCKLVYIYCHPGVFDHMEGFNELKKAGLIDEYFLYKTKGMEIHKAETSGDRAAGYLCTAISSDDLWRKIEYIDSNIKAVSNTGEDIMIHGLLQN